MPSTYAHYLFGEKVAASLTGDLAATVKSNKQLFYIGLHGPDILFYYKPLSKNEINSLGYAMHGRTMAEFLKRAAHMPQLSQNKAAMAYLLGFVCHYALDHACHPYVEKAMSVLNLAHSEIENEFDRYLIYYTGHDLKHTDLTKHITPSDGNAEVIAPFFENVTAKQVKKALNSMKFYIGMLACNRVYKRVLVKGCLKLSGKYASMKSVMMYKKPINECGRSNKGLYGLFECAVEDCLALESEAYGFINGKNVLSDKFNFTFGEGDAWQNIEV